MHLGLNTVTNTACEMGRLLTRCAKDTLIDTTNTTATPTAAEFLPKKKVLADCLMKSENEDICALKSELKCSR